LNSSTETHDGRVLRRAQSGDEAAFQALQQAAYAPNRDLLGVEPLPLQMAAAEVLSRYEVWLLVEGDEVKGALALEPRRDDVEIWSVSVEPSRQNGGVGRVLLEAAERRALDLGLPTIRLFTGEALTKNVDWYRRRGYAVERIETLPDRRLVHMVKTISD
jgi:GNAT superfamily N-acetyltransferase